MIVGGIEAGGTKFVCVVGDERGQVIRHRRFATRRPEETLADAVDFFRAAATDGLAPEAIGIAAFGPVELRPGPAFGHLTATTKPGWSGADLVGPLRAALGVPVAIETDVTAAAVAEARVGAARGLATFVYITVGTGIGGGALIEGRPLHGLVHPEMGHMAVPREPDDDFAGVCPFHGDCWEGLACGPAIAARWGSPAEHLDGDALRRAVDLQARYLASGIRNIVYALAPERIVIGGGVSRLPGLVDAAAGRFRERIAGYPGLEAHASDAFIVRAGLDQMAGPTGALLIAAEATR
jgi:fructokinase